MFKPEILIPIIIGVIVLLVAIFVFINANKKKNLNKEFSEKVLGIINNLGGKIYEKIIINLIFIRFIRYWM